jgi:hypothetical protein
MTFTKIRFPRWLYPAAFVLSIAAGSAGAGESQKSNTTETVEVERKELKGPKHPSLQFLKDHHVFIRARLEELRTKTTTVRSGDAEMLDERFLRLKAMSEAIAAARDTVSSQHLATGARDTLSSVAQLAELEAQLDVIEQILADQRRRLLFLEEDFLGHQETALVILVKGLSGKPHVPESIVLTDQNDVVHVDLTPVQRASLQQGGIAQVYHQFVEPREHLLEVGFTGGRWSESPPVAVKVEAARDRITFLELDLSSIDASAGQFGLATTVWHR